MNEDFPPRQLAAPTVRQRSRSKPKPVPLSPEKLARRAEIARVLGASIDAANQYLKSLTDEQRKAVFFKVTHDGPVDLTGTGLKALIDRSSDVTFAIPTGQNIDEFAKKVQQFATSTPEAGVVKHQTYANIQDVSPGQPKDRLSDELFAMYDSLIKQDLLICEIEMLAPLDSSRKRRRSTIAGILQDLNNAFASGVHGTLFESEEHDGICRAVIRCTGKMFQQLVEDGEWQRKISWFEPKPKFETFHTIWNDFAFEKLAPIAPPPDDAPLVCIVDSGVTSGNPFLQPVTRDEDLMSFLKHDPDNPFDENGHGSGVASLAAYHVINLDEGAENTPKIRIAGARILGSDCQIEEERLLSKVLEEVVATFVPRGVRIFNLSVGDLAKKWNQDSKRTQPRTSWTARTLDRLSREYDIVFVVSAGNIHPSAIRDFLRAGTPYPVYLSDPESRILDPGQAALAISVGSISGGTLVVNSPDTAIALDFEPSPFTRSGPGIKSETKPDLVEVGGNLVADVDFRVVRRNPGTNVVMASNQLSPAAAHNSGTSFSAPRVTHKLAVLLHELKQFGLEYVSAPLLKAFLINSAVYRGDIQGVKDQLDSVRRKDWLNVLGHGWPDSVRATDCDPYSILLFTQGELAVNQVAFFDVPVPALFSESTSRKKITVTVVHDPEVQRWGLESYFGIDLKWRMFRGDVSRETIRQKMSYTADEETDNEDGEKPQPVTASELEFEHRITRRSRGSVQHDLFEWQNHKTEFSMSHYTLAITATSRWSRKTGPTKFGLVVRIEDLGGTIPVYAAVVAELDVLIEQST
jgi:hypothetical protein